MTGTGRTGGVRALVVDDEEHLARLVADYLTREGFATDVALDGERALELARTQRPDVVILDLMLPGIDGVEVCRALRTFTDAYVIMLTARAEEVDKLIGLAVGADDYLTKPFSPRELTARVRAMLRRPRSPQPADTDAPVRQFGDLTIDPAAREALVAGTPTELTRLEFDLLEMLSARPRMAFSRRQLVERVWGRRDTAAAPRVAGTGIAAPARGPSALPPGSAIPSAGRRRAGVVISDADCGSAAARPGSSSRHSDPASRSIAALSTWSSRPKLCRTRIFADLAAGSYSLWTSRRSRTAVPSVFRRLAVRTNMSPDSTGETPVKAIEHAETCH